MRRRIAEKMGSYNGVSCDPDTELLARIAHTCSRGDEIASALLDTPDWQEIRDSLPLRPALAEEWQPAQVCLKRPW